jgi:uncharacterized protein (TIGR03086 family)
MSGDELEVLARGLEQTADLLGEVVEERLSAPTPCDDWTLSDLVDHVVLGTANFARSVRGEDVDWSAPTPQVGDDRVGAFRSGAADLLAAWRLKGTDGASIGPDWQSAEIAVHDYDLAAALGRPTADLDPAVAERGLAFMQANLRPEIRGEAFGPERPAPDGADPYQRIAAFAGRSV